MPIVFNDFISLGNFNGYIDNFSFFNQDDYIIGSYSFNSGQGNILYDFSGNQNHGTINGATWSEVTEGCTDELACNYNPNAIVDDTSCDYACNDNGDYSLSFDGVDDYVIFQDNQDFTHNSELNNLPNSDFSIFTTFYYDGSNGTIFSRGITESAGSNELVALYVNNGLLNFFMRGTPSSQNETFIQSGPIELGWNSVLIQRDYSNSVTLLVNEQSEIITSDNATQFPGNSNNGISIFDMAYYIGCRIDGETNERVEYFQGMISDFRIWNELISIENINSSNPLLELEFENTDGIIFDISGNQNHGMINGATWIENIVGCSDELACNYNSDANINDGSCDYSCHENGDYCLYFDGSGSSIVDFSQVSFEGTDTLSFSLDFKLEDYIHQSDHNHIFDFEGENIRYSLVIGSGYIEMRYEGYGISHRFDTNSLDDIWHNIIIQGTSNQMNILFDGELVINETWTEPLVEHSFTPSSFGSFLGGNDSSNPYGYFIKGNLDNFIISNDFLSYDDVQNLSFSEKIIAHYNFNSADGNILHDISGNQNHGSIFNPQWQERVEAVYVEVISPNGGEVWQMGETYEITWDSNLSNTGYFYIKMRK